MLGIPTNLNTSCISVQQRTSAEAAQARHDIVQHTRRIAFRASWGVTPFNKADFLDAVFGANRSSCTPYTKRLPKCRIEASASRARGIVAFAVPSSVATMKPLNASQPLSMKAGSLSFLSAFAHCRMSNKPALWAAVRNECLILKANSDYILARCTCLSGQSSHLHHTCWGCCSNGLKAAERRFHSTPSKQSPTAPGAAAEAAAVSPPSASDTCTSEGPPVSDRPAMPARGWLLLCCGASLFFGGVGSTLWLLLDHPEPLSHAWDAVKKDPRVREALGGEIRRNWWWGGYIHEKDARIKMTVSGPTGLRGYVTCDLMRRPDGQWQVLLLNFVCLDSETQQTTQNPMSGVVALVPDQLPRSQQHRNFLRGCPIAALPTEAQEASKDAHSSQQGTTSSSSSSNGTGS
ncbi:uncharacterized protein LOC113147499 [Cyclospora cayetanensis]|uniref:Uncharacterized protein LOC113147499 n=1 Tax=Cyclospora cayetanensis TaxID=88456 RepID=A0A6P6S1P7_9EIME|nr:uncharacterized protein LOC113147499 [Cyclospora cayetanensis]